MIVLLAGAPEIARRMLAEKFVREHDDWKHLPLERVEQLTKMQQIDAEDGDPMLIQIACHCAREIGEQGNHVILSHPSGTNEVELMREEFGKDFIAFHLGRVNEEDIDAIVEGLFDYLIDSSQHSVNDAYDLMLGVLEETRL